MRRIDRAAKAAGKERKKERKKKRKEKGEFAAERLGSCLNSYTEWKLCETVIFPFTVLYCWRKRYMGREVRDLGKNLTFVFQIYHLYLLLLYLLSLCCCDVSIYYYSFVF